MIHHAAYNLSRAALRRTLRPLPTLRRLQWIVNDLRHGWRLGGRAPGPHGLLVDALEFAAQHLERQPGTR